MREEDISKYFKAFRDLPAIDLSKGRTKENKNIISLIENFILSIIPIC
jgi:hypothetical protein